MFTRMQALRAEHDKVRSAIETIERSAVEAERDLTDEEAGDLSTLDARQQELARSIMELAERDDRIRATGDILARFNEDGPAGALGIKARAELPSMSPGEYGSLFMRSVVFKDVAASAELTAYHTTLARAADLTSDISGILPTLIIGDLIKFVDANRYAVNAMRELPMPAAGSSFIRPRVTQTTTSATQSTQNTALSSRKMTIVGDSVSKATHGGFVTITEQDIDWSDPSFLQIVFEDLAQAYAIDTETTATAAIVAAATNNVTGFTVGTAASDVFMAKLAAAAGTVYTNSKQLPDTLFAALTTWQYLVSLVDGNKRPLFPNLNPVNAIGTLDATSFDGNPMGLKLVVSPLFATDTCVVGASRYCERFEQNKGLAQLAAPSTMSVDVAYRGYFATNVKAQGLCSMQTA